MLYISRLSEYNTAEYYVMDTDDGVETLVSWSDIARYVIELGMDIKGVSYKSADGTLIARELLVEVYQPKASATLSQTKFKVLYDIDVKVCNDSLVGLRVGTKTPPGLRINVSDFASGILSTLDVRFSDKLRGNIPITLVLDDSVAFMGFEAGVRDWKVSYDITAVSDERIASYFYRQLMIFNDDELDIWETRLTDRPDRFTYWQCAGLLHHYVDSSAADFIQSLPNRESISEALETRYFAVFEATAKLGKQLNLRSYAKRDDLLKLAKRWLNFKKVLKASRTDDYYWLRAYFIDVFDFLHRLASVDSSRLYMLENYVKYFVVTERVRVLYVEFCNAVAEDLRSIWG